MADSASTLPAGWVERFDETRGIPYYFDLARNQSQWDRPAYPSSPAAGPPLPASPAVAAQLPEGWVARTDLSNGVDYYFDLVNQCSQWDRPTQPASRFGAEEAAAAEAAAAAAAAATAAREAEERAAAERAAAERAAAERAAAERAAVERAAAERAAAERAAAERAAAERAEAERAAAAREAAEREAAERAAAEREAAEHEAAEREAAVREAALRDAAAAQAAAAAAAAATAAAAVSADTRVDDSGALPATPSAVLAPLPENWVERFDETHGIPYYFDLATQRSHWERPSAVAVAEAAAEAAVPPPTAGGAAVAQPAEDAPPPLPEGWVARVDSTHGVEYYFDLVNQCSQWEWPTQPAVVVDAIGGGDTSLGTPGPAAKAEPEPAPATAAPEPAPAPVPAAPAPDLFAEAPPVAVAPLPEEAVETAAEKAAIATAALGVCIEAALTMGEQQPPPHAPGPVDLAEPAAPRLGSPPPLPPPAPPPAPPAAPPAPAMLVPPLGLAGLGAPPSPTLPSPPPAAAPRPKASSLAPSTVASSVPSPAPSSVASPRVSQPMSPRAAAIAPPAAAASTLAPPLEPAPVPPAPSAAVAPPAGAAAHEAAIAAGERERSALRETIAELRAQLSSVRRRCAGLETRLDNEGTVLLDAFRRHKRQLEAAICRHDRLVQHAAGGRDWLAGRLARELERGRTRVVWAAWRMAVRAPHHEPGGDASPRNDAAGKGPAYSNDQLAALVAMTKARREAEAAATAGLAEAPSARASKLAPLAPAAERRRSLYQLSYEGMADLVLQLEEALHGAGVQPPPRGGTAARGEEGEQA